MNLQADINWIKSELNKVTDPHLIEVFKNLLIYRKSKEELSDSFFSTTVDDMKNRAEKSLKSIKEGKTRNIADFMELFPSRFSVE